MTDADFSACAGIPVATFRLSDFPHWDLLRDTRTLSPQQFRERVEAIQDAVRSSNPVTNAGMGAFFTVEHAQQAAQQLQPAYYNSYSTHHISPGVIASHRLCETANWNGRPYVLLDTSTEGFLPAEITRIEAAFIFRDPRDSALNIYSLRTGIPVDKLASHFNGPYAAFFSDLHEMRHLIQFSPAKPNDIYSYFKEADADAVAFRAFNGLKLNEHVKFERDARHLGAIMTSSRKHWIAPMLDAFEAGMPLPNSRQVTNAIDEIRANLFVDAKKLTSRFFEPETMVTQLSSGTHKVHGLAPERIEELSNSFGQWAGGHYNRTPEIILTALRQRAEGVGFYSPLAQKIAERILEASDRINKALTHNDDTPKVPPAADMKCERSGGVFSKVSYINYQLKL